MTDDKEFWHEGCGVFGVFAPGEDVARITFFGLFALQHRGEESAGIAVTDGERIFLHREMGLIIQAFTEEDLQRLRGFAAIGHNRYSTAGSTTIQNAQPFVFTGPHGEIAIAHNGNLVNALHLRAELEAQGVEFETTSDTEVIAKLILHSPAPTLEEAILDMMGKVRGAYSLTILSHDKLYAVRDPWGVRPLCLGIINGKHYVVASETCALEPIGAKFVREVEAGEIVVIDHNGLRSIKAVEEPRYATCIFEFIYFARPDSKIFGRTVFEVRRRLGHLLAREHPVKADLVVPVPDTGIPAAVGFAEASKITFMEGIIKNRYIGRTFIQPDQRMRDLGVKMKLTPLRDVLAGKRVVLVDDSIVRGTTTGQKVRMLFEAGAREVHVRISSPPYRYPCFYGIDTPDRNELIAARMSVDEIRDFLGATTLGYLSIESLVRATGLPKNKFCLACFNNRYPIPIPRDIKLHKFALEERTRVK